MPILNGSNKQVVSLEYFYRMMQYHMQSCATVDYTWTYWLVLCYNAVHLLVVSELEIVL